MFGNKGGTQQPSLFASAAGTQAATGFGANQAATGAGLFGQPGGAVGGQAQLGLFSQ